MFRHSILKQAQATRGGATANGTLESPLSTFQARAIADSSTLQQGTEKTDFRNSYVRMCIFIFVQCMPRCPTWSLLFPIQDSDSPTHQQLQPAHQAQPLFRWCRTTRTSLACLCLKHHTFCCIFYILMS